MSVRHTFFIAAVFVLMCFSHAVTAAGINVFAKDENGAPLANTIVTLTGPAALPIMGSEHPEMAQIRTQFQPHVLVVRRDSRVAFPNLDSTRHQVYSFSRVKRFVTRLYAGREADPVEFDQVGLVPIGCHIHDRMQAFIYVTDAPQFALTDATGKASFDALPAGEYDIEVLHPWQKKPGSQTRSTRLLSTSRDINLRFDLGEIGADPRIPQRPVSNPLIRSNPFAR